MGGGKGVCEWVWGAGCVSGCGEQGVCGWGWGVVGMQNIGRGWRCSGRVVTVFFGYEKILVVCFVFVCDVWFGRAYTRHIAYR